MAMFQRKIYGRWDDVELPVATLEDLATLVKRLGSKPLCAEMQFLANMVRDSWGTGAWRTIEGSPSDDLFVPSYSGPEFKLELIQFAVISHRADTLKLGLLWSTKQDVSTPYQTRKSWDEQEGMVEVTFLPGN